jgi:hypothetical protein
MKRSLLFGLIILVCGIGPVFSQAVPGNLQNNRYYLESVRLTKLAQESYEYGDYDASADYAAEALRYAQLSDEYVALQLKIREAGDAITAAKSRIDWADSSGASQTYPDEYGAAGQAYSEALSFRQGEEWDEAIAAAHRAVDALAFVAGAPALAGEKPLLPARYTVRSWASSRDCLWNIAGRPWAYGDPHKWRLIYNANRAKFPNPDNPNVIEPGMVLDIPSLQSERREGAWDPNKAYEPIR